jgi:proteasome lid subunit RPN8/RPN11
MTYHERVGIIRRDFSLVEFENIHEKPEDHFRIKGADVLQLEDEDTYATWHTHPDDDSNLSAEDYRCFLDWPQLAHFVIGTDGITRYGIVEDAIVKENHFTWLLEGAAPWLAVFRGVHPNGGAEGASLAD